MLTVFQVLLENFEEHWIQLIRGLTQALICIRLSGTPRRGSLWSQPHRRQLLS